MLFTVTIMITKITCAVCDEGPSSLQIMDLSFLPDSVSVIYDDDSLITRSHNIFIDTAYSKLYSCSNKILAVVMRLKY